MKVNLVNGMSCGENFYAGYFVRLLQMKGQIMKNILLPILFLFVACSSPEQQDLIKSNQRSIDNIYNKIDSLIIFHSEIDTVIKSFQAEWKKLTAEEFASKISKQSSVEGIIEMIKNKETTMSKRDFQLRTYGDYVKSSEIQIQDKLVIGSGMVVNFYQVLSDKIFRDSYYYIKDGSYWYKTYGIASWNHPPDMSDADAEKLRTFAEEWEESSEVKF